MGFKILLGIGCFVVFISSCKAQVNSKNDRSIGWNDSIALNNTIKLLSLCEEIQLANDSADLIVSEKGFSLLLLSSISKQTNQSINIPISTGGIVLTTKYKVADLKEQMDVIRKKFCK